MDGENGMNSYDVYCGVDVGKSFHYVFAFDGKDEVFENRRVDQDDTDLTTLFAALAERGRCLVVVDQPKNIGALTLACARKAGCAVAYLPGLAMRRAAGLIPGDAKTDERDAYVIALAASRLPESLRALPAPEELRSMLGVLCAHDEDCRYDATREKNRLRAFLLEDHPAFERAIKDTIESPFLLALLMRFGGPWGMRAAGKAKVSEWVSKQKYVNKKFAKRLMDAAWEMAERPFASALCEDVCIPACARRIAELKAERKDMGTRMEALLADDMVAQVLLTMPGIGVRTAATLRVIVDILLFDSVDKLASYAGLAPRTRQSGTSIKGETAARSGNRVLKSALFLSALAALKTDDKARAYYDKKRVEGKTHRAAIICLAMRRLKIIYAIMRDAQPYRTAA
jgi:transposase